MNVSKPFMQNLNRVALTAAVCLLTLTSALALTNENHALSPDRTLSANFDPTAVFKSCWIDYNVYEDGRKGMRIHVNFEATGLKGVDLKLVARVQKGESLLPSSSSYSNAEGELETSYSIKPGYPTTVYEDGQMFLPYSEINLRSGVWGLKLDIDLKYEDGDLIQHLGFKEFEFTAPNFAAEASNKSTITTKVNRVWVDQNVYEKGQHGMRIHVDFEVSGLKDVGSNLIVRVQKEDDSFLMSDSANSNGNGELELSYALKPRYATTLYRDASVFLPYSEIALRRGVWYLKLDIDLNNADGELIEHLTFHEFEYNR